MADFKKLAAVDVAETANDAAKVLIEENGVIKRVPKDEVGGIKVAAAEVGQTIVVKAVDENGNPTEWEAVDKVTSWNDLKDKPFYEGELTVVVPETTVTPNMTEPTILGEYTDLISVGATCIVSFNDTDYKCIVYDVGHTITIGNAALLGVEGGNNEPFVILVGPEMGIMLFTEESEVTVSVKAKPIKQIDEKYIPTGKPVAYVYSTSEQSEAFEYDSTVPAFYIPSLLSEIYLSPYGTHAVYAENNYLCLHDTIMVSASTDVANSVSIDELTVGETKTFTIETNRRIRSAYNADTKSIYFGIKYNGIRTRLEFSIGRNTPVIPTVTSNGNIIYGQLMNITENTIDLAITRTA